MFKCYIRYVNCLREGPVNGEHGKLGITVVILKIFFIAVL